MFYMDGIPDLDAKQFAKEFDYVILVGCSYRGELVPGEDCVFERRPSHWTKPFSYKTKLAFSWGVWTKGDGLQRERVYTTHRELNRNRAVPRPIRLIAVLLQLQPLKIQAEEAAERATANSRAC